MRSLIFVMVLASGCARPDKALERVATEANPVIESLREPVSVVNSTTATDSQVLEACRQAIERSAPLQYLDFGDTTSGVLSVHEVLLVEQGEKDIHCGAESDDPNHVSACVGWCRQMFGNLVSAVDRARSKAAQKHVTLQSLR